MPQQGPLRWLDGKGWLILVGGGEIAYGETDPIDANLLSITNLDRPIVVLMAEGARTQAEAVLEHYIALGGPGGEAFTFDLLSRTQLDAPSFLDLLREAGILYLGGENPLPLSGNLLNTQAFRQIVEGFSSLQGLTLVGVGAGAAALGRWVFSPEPPYAQAPGLGFLMNAVVVPHFTRTEDSLILRSLPRIAPDLLGLGIPDGAALALGPDGQVEQWGTGQITAVVAATGDETFGDTWEDESEAYD